MTLHPWRDWSRYSSDLSRKAIKRLGPSSSFPIRYSPFPLLEFFGAQGSDHPFASASMPWLSLRETQVTSSLADLLSCAEPGIVLAFLRALDPSIPWPESISALNIADEVHVGAGRIDLLISGRGDGLPFGAVIEAKFGHPFGQKTRSTHTSDTRSENTSAHPMRQVASPMRSSPESATLQSTR